MLIGIPLGKRLFGRPRRRCCDNIKVDLREVDCEDGRWMELAGFGISGFELLSYATTVLTNG
jgi:hypothetical protein